MKNDISMCGAGRTYQVNHVRREEGDAILLEKLFILIEHAVEPREQLLGAVVGMD